MTCARVQAEVAEDDEVEEDDSPPELIYAQAWGDSVTIATTNTYKLSEFSNATNHGRLHKEVQKARDMISSHKKDEALMTKYGYKSRADILDWGGTIPEGESLIAFYAVRLGKGKVNIWSYKVYGHAVTGKKPAAATGGTLYKNIMHTVERSEWEAMVVKFDAVHELNPPTLAVGEFAHRCEREDCKTPLDMRKRTGLLNWANTMTDLYDLEIYYLMTDTSRTDSTDPAEQLKEKLKKIKDEGSRRAEVFAARKEVDAQKALEREEAAKRMRERASQAWESNAEAKHEMLVNDDAKVVAVNQIARSIRSIEKVVVGVAIPTVAQLPPLAEWLKQHGLERIQEILERDEWHLRTMLATVDESTFESDFSSLPAARRRDLQVALRLLRDELAPAPTPSPPHKARTHRKRPRGFTGMPDSTPASVRSFRMDDDDDDLDVDDTGSLAPSLAPSLAASSRTGQPSMSGSQRNAPLYRDLSSGVHPRGKNL